MGWKLSETEELFLLLTLREEGVIGRYRLARTLGVSEGVARGIVGKLQRGDLVKTRAKSGVALTSRGDARLEALLRRAGVKRVMRLRQGAVETGPENVVFHLRDAGHRVHMGLEQRDAAIKAGASGAVTLVFDGRRLSFPGVDEAASQRNPRTVDLLLKELNLKRGDTIVICFSDAWWSALRGGTYAAATLS